MYILQWGRTHPGSGSLTTPEWRSFQECVTYFCGLECCKEFIQAPQVAWSLNNKGVGNIFLSILIIICIVLVQHFSQQSTFATFCNSKENNLVAGSSTRAREIELTFFFDSFCFSGLSKAVVSKVQCLQSLKWKGIVNQDTEKQSNLCEVLAFPGKRHLNQHWLHHLYWVLPYCINKSSNVVFTL